MLGALILQADRVEEGYAAGLQLLRGLLTLEGLLDRVLRLLEMGEGQRQGQGQGQREGQEQGEGEGGGADSWKLVHKNISGG